MIIGYQDVDLCSMRIILNHLASVDALSCIPLFPKLARNRSYLVYLQVKPYIGPVSNAYCLIHPSIVCSLS